MRHSHVSTHYSPIQNQEFQNRYFYPDYLIGNNQQAGKGVQFK